VIGFSEAANGVPLAADGPMDAVPVIMEVEERFGITILRATNGQSEVLPSCFCSC
jgi:hypothetical protein